MVSDVSAHGYLALLFGAYGIVHHGGSTQWEHTVKEAYLPYGRPETKGEEEKMSRVSVSPFKGILLMT